MKVTLEYIESFMNQAETEEHVFFGKSLVVAYKFENGFVLTGVGACVDPAEFDLEIGRAVARKQVVDQLWKMEGYLLNHRMYHRARLLEKTGEFI